jgi:hypothetical protein
VIPARKAIPETQVQLALSVQPGRKEWLVRLEILVPKVTQAQLAPMARPALLVQRVQQVPLVLLALMALLVRLAPLAQQV